MALKHKIRHYFSVASYVVLTLLVLFVFSVAARIVFNPSSVRAGSAVFYPKFCLGGWDHPQKASGIPELDQLAPGSAYSTDNSAYLSSSVSAQIFCGYFSNEDKTNAPSEVTIAFQWHMVGTEAQATPQPVEVLIVPDTPSAPVQETVQYDSVGPSTIILTETATSSTSTEAVPEVIPASVPESESVVTSPVEPEPVPEPTPVLEVVPAPAPEPAPETPADAPTSFIQRFLSTITPAAHAQSVPESMSSSPLFEVSYSVDGIRWTSVGTVGEDNWRGYAVNIPVRTWDELDRLQVTVSPLPSLDKRHDMYLESISVRAAYDRTLTESAGDAVAAVANAVDTVAEVITNIPFVANIIPQPQKIFVTKKTLSFSVHGSPEGLDGKASPTAMASADGSSLNIFGSCSDKYFVVLVYKNENDFKADPASLVANEARECENGSFSYDLSSLPSDIQSGTYYVLTGEEGDRGPWKPTSSPFPVSVVASTTVEELIQ